MAVIVNTGVVLQVISVLAAVFGVVCSLYELFETSKNLEDARKLSKFILMLFVLLFCLFLIFAEIYVFDFFKYIAFILTTWGKALFYLFLGFFFYSDPRDDSLGFAAAIIFWVLSILYLVMVFVSAGPARPIGQRAAPPKFEANSKDYYQDQTGGQPPQPQKQPGSTLNHPLEK
jgi:hypothetical protein